MIARRNGLALNEGDRVVGMDSINTDRSKLLALADAVEKLTGADREVDAEIDCAIRFKDLRPARPDDFDGKYGYSAGNIKADTGFLQSLRFTASLDCAMTLVPAKPFPELRPGEWWWSVDSLGCDAHVAYENRDAGIPEYSATAATPALALTAAALRAQAEALS